MCSESEARKLCENDVHCGGIIDNNHGFELRGSSNPEHSDSGEASYVKIPCDPDVADTITKKVAPSTLLT